MEGISRQSGTQAAQSHPGRVAGAFGKGHEWAADKKRSEISRCAGRAGERTAEFPTFYPNNEHHEGLWFSADDWIRGSERRISASQLPGIWTRFYGLVSLYVLAFAIVQYLCFRYKRTFGFVEYIH